MPLTAETLTLPQKFRDASRLPPWLRVAISDLIAGKLPWPLLLYGTTGTLKTTAALCLHDHAGGYFYTFEGLFSKFMRCVKGVETRQTSQGDVEMTESDLWHQLGTSKLVVVDEIGAKKNSAEYHFGMRDHTSTLKRLLDVRECKPFVVTSNLDLDGLEALYDDRVSSRLAAGTVLNLAGPDRRLADKP